MNPLWMIAADLRKTLLATLGVLLLLSLTFSATIAMNLFDRSLREAGAASAQEFDLVVGAAGSRLDLVLTAVFLRTDEVLPLLGSATVDRLRGDARVALSSPLVFADHYQDSPIVGVGTEFRALRPHLPIVAGRWASAPFEVVAGASSSLVPGAHFHGSHGAGEHSGFAEKVHEDQSYVVVGKLQKTGTPWDRALITPAESLWFLHGDEGASHEVSAVLVKPKDFAAAYSLRADYREGVTTAAFPGEVLASLFGLFDSFETALSLVSTAFQIVVFAAVVLSLLAGLPSKVRWIGLLRALGAGPGYIFMTLWIQSAIVFAAAGVAGALFGFTAAQALGAFVADNTGLALAAKWSWNETGLLLIFWTIGLVGALVPAFLGYRTSVRRSLLGQ